MAMFSDHSTIPLDVIASTLRGHWGEISRQKGKPPGKNPKAAAILVSEVYTNTFRSPLPFVVLGEGAIRRDEFLKVNFGLITGGDERTSSHGAILGEKRWSTVINDFFMLGLINGMKDVYLTASRIPTVEQLWDESENQMTALGREIAILAAAGYYFVETPLGIGFTSSELDPNHTYEEIARDVNSIRKPEELATLLERLSPSSKSCSFVGG